MVYQAAWYVKATALNKDIALGWRSINAIENDVNIVAAVPVASFCFSVESKLRALRNWINIKSLVLPTLLEEHPAPGLDLLSAFKSLEVLEINLASLSGINYESWCFPRLQKLVLNDISLNDALVEWIGGLTTLTCLHICDCSYDGSLALLSNLKNLEVLLLTGYLHFLSTDCDFISCLEKLSSVSLEIGSPNETCLRLLADCKAEIHLKLRGSYRVRQVSALCSISNLSSLTFTTSFGFKIPSEFKDLCNVHSILFVDEGNCFNEIKGLENIPTDISNLTLDLNFPSLYTLDSVLTSFSRTLKKLTLKTNTIPDSLGLDGFKNLESLELCARKRFCENVLDEVGKLSNLKHLGVEGCLNFGTKLIKTLTQLKLYSLSVSNALLTSETIHLIAQQPNLKILTLTCCFFTSFDLGFFPSFPFLTRLNLDRCLPLDNYLPDLLEIPQLKTPKSLDLRLNKIQHGTSVKSVLQAREMPLRLFIQNNYN